jgi:hypothetical protein
MPTDTAKREPVCGEQQAAEYQMKSALGQEDRDALDDVGLPPCHCSHGLVGDPPGALTIHEAVAS